MALRVMLVLPTRTYRAAAFLEAAARLGMEVVVASNEASSLAAFMPGRQVTLDLGRPGESAGRAADALSDRPVDAVVGVDETAVTTAAAVAARLGVRHHPVEAVEITRDKAALRRRLAAAGMPQPAFVEVPRAGAAGRRFPVAGIRASVGFPCVVKPVGLSGSRGVIRADGEPGLAAAITRARAICGDPGAPLLVESFVSGPEVAVEGLVRDGRLDVLTIFDKPDPLEGPFFEETIYLRPSRLPGAEREAIRAVCVRAAEAVGLTDGPVHAELRLGGAEPVLIEIAARSIGGLCSRVLRFASGATLEEVILRHAAGLPAGSIELAEDATGVMMIPIPGRGTLAAVRGVDAARSVGGIEDVSITIPPGEELLPLPEGDRYLGFIFARGPSPQAVEAALREAHAALGVDWVG